MPAYAGPSIPHLPHPRRTQGRSRPPHARPRAWLSWWDWPWRPRVSSNPHGALADSEFCIPEEPADYRMSEFRTAVPCTLAGARVVSTEDLRRLLEELSPVLVDVLPSPRRPEGLSEDAIWQPPARSNIPGSVWLPNTGFGVLPLEEEAYLRANLVRLTAGDPSRPIVFYCLADCWMSWNAARRAMEWGYASVVWYPHGTDGWEDAGLPLAESSPVPREAGAVDDPRAPPPTRRRGGAQSGYCPAGRRWRAATSVRYCRAGPRRRDRPGPRSRHRERPR